MNEKLDAVKIAANAKMARKRAGFTTQEAARKAIGCSRTTIVGWENRKSPTPINGSPFLLEAARKYRVRPDWLAKGEDPDGYPWSEPAQPIEPATTAIPAAESKSEIALGLEALARSQAYLAQALASTIPTVAREVLASVDHRMPQEMRETPYIKALRSTILGQLASNDMAAMPSPPKTSHQASRRKRR